MNIKILDSWLREYLKTSAKAEKIAEALSLTSVSVERLEKYENDFIYDIEVTTNRPDLMSVLGLAREACAILPQFNIKAEFIKPKLENSKFTKENLPITIKNDPSLVNRIIAVIMEVSLKQSPEFIKKRLEATGIRSLNNLIDITNYVMRDIGHPTHVFDYDRLTTKKLIIRKAKLGEKIVTLDDKEFNLLGEDIVADNGEGILIDLLGVMGTANSVVTENTKRILFFIDNNEPHHIRKTSMNLGIRSEAAILNEKGVDPEIGMDAMLKGIQLYKEIANGKMLSNIIDIYPNKPKIKNLSLLFKKINKVIGVEIPQKTSVEILNKLGFNAKIQGKNIDTTIPSWRNKDIEIEEDIIEEIARVYGYHRLPNVLPPLTEIETYSQASDPFYWEKRIKNALKYWGFTEVYTYSLVSEALLEGPTDEATALSNPLSQDLVYLRKTLVPSLLSVIQENPNRNEIKIFELANVYYPKADNLPNEVLTIAAVLKKEKVSFYEVKGVVEKLLSDLGIKDLTFKHKESGGIGSDIYIDKEYLGEIEILTDKIANFELNFELILKYANLKKIYKPIPKYPAVIEDVRLLINPDITHENIIKIIKRESKLVINVELIDIYNNKKTFRIFYQHPKKNLTSEEVALERKNIYSTLQKELGAKIS